jgi:hypothetical protein
LECGGRRSADKLLVGAHGDDAGGTDGGRAYLFHTNGSLITTLTNPASGISNWFGYSVAAPARDKLLVGAPNDDTDATNAGAAYGFDLRSGGQPGGHAPESRPRCVGSVRSVRRRRGSRCGVDRHTRP